MANISQVKLPNGTTYDIKDSVARNTFAEYRRLDDPYYDTTYITENQVGDLIVTGSSRFLNTINGDISGSALKATQDGSGNVITSTYVKKSGDTMTGLLKAQANVYTDSYTGALDMQNSNIYGVNSIITADLADNAGEGIHFYRDSTHVDTLWVAGGDIMFVPNRALGTSTTAANSQKVGRFISNPTSGQVVITDGTTGGMQSSGYTIAKSVPSDAKFTDTTYSVATTSANGLMSATDKARFNKIGSGHFGTNGDYRNKKIKIKINATNLWMLCFTVTLYQNYRATKVMISGYQYGSNYWYQPKARLLGDSDGTETISVYFGYDSTNNLWVGFDGDLYTGVVITDVVNGYSQISDFSDLFTISTEDSLATLQTTVTASSRANYAVSAGSASTATKATQDSDGNTIKSTYLKLSGGTMTGRLSTSKPIGQILTGTGTAAQDKGSGVSNRYVPAKWTFNTGLTATDGDIITIKIPVAGHDYGVYLSIDNGTTYYPIVCNSTGRLTTHYPVDNYITLVYEPGGSAASMFALNGGDSRITVTGGVWRVINYYDSNSNDTAYYTRRIYPNMKTGSNKIFPYTMIMQNSDGRWESIVTSSSTGTSKARNTHGFRLGTILLHYGSGTYNENDAVPTYNIWSMHSGLIDHRYSFNTANNSTSGTTGYNRVN